MSSYYNGEYKNPEYERMIDNHINSKTNLTAQVTAKVTPSNLVWDTRISKTFDFSINIDKDTLFKYFYGRFSNLHLINKKAITIGGIMIFGSTQEEFNDKYKNGMDLSFNLKLPFAPGEYYMHSDTEGNVDNTKGGWSISFGIDFTLTVI